MRQLKKLAIAVSAALVAGSVLAAPQQAADDSILVVFKPGVGKAERMSVMQRAGVSLRELDAEGRDIRMQHIADGRIAKVKLPSGVHRDHMIKKLAQHPAIEIAEPNYLVQPLTQPDDPRFNELWGLSNTGQSGGTVGADISALDAWQVTTGSHDIVIGVIDSGMDYNHPDLIANRWENDGSYPGHQFGWSTLNPDGDPMDSGSHGTHVAGTIGASGNNGIGVTGVSWNVTLIPCQFLGPTGGSTAGAIECISYFTDLKTNHGVDVKATNNSWGGGGFSEALKLAIEDGGDAGILFIAASGNDGNNADVAPMYPAAYDSDIIVSVASTDRNDNMSGFSNYGLVSVDLGAPGSAILSTVPGAGYSTFSGTSMAAPHVAGAAALVWSLDPSIPALEMKDILMESGDPLDGLEGMTVSGKRLNVATALEEADPAPGFRMSLDPRNQQIIAGEQTEYTLEFSSVAGWNDEITLSLDSTPEFAGATLSSTVAFPGDVISLLIDSDAETPWGTYQMVVNATDSASGELVREVTAGLTVIPQGLVDFPYENTTPVAIPDNDSSGIESIISVGQDGHVFGVEVGVNITHTWRGDLIVSLTSPEGTEHVLHNRTGGSADDLIESWTLDSFNGEAMQGDWTLFVSDNAALDTGTLNSWDLTITALSDGDIVDPDPSAPEADFSYSASGLLVNFTDMSTDDDDDIVSWSWNFGDGISSTEQSPSHSYNAAGSYNVSLTVEDSTGLSDTVAKTVTVSDAVSSIDLWVQRAQQARTGSSIVDLRWSGAESQLDLYRDGVKVATIDNNGRYRDRFNTSADMVVYQLCAEGTDICSAEVVAQF
ncbi:S8 family serine peptidase [Alkalimonas collagenimarina]|uniref:S8 family serine peptidase n=1 Tax=Alkalimonas collagenimarina TaxID=400390 RepID=A0ABT9H2J2_9GAMM|nr:S8 family serine peptidase [Alkalimonas collagenimarina]MDP4537428.1 S8 family serine peptidase [Alkalimonas collagenimarina]